MTPIRGRQRWGALASSLFLVSSLVLAIAAPSVAGVLTCGGLVVDIVGTEGDDELTGTAGADVIHGLGGDDVIFGLDGADTICGGSGADEIRSGKKADRVFGGGGADVIYGGYGADYVLGGPGHDTIYGGSGPDHLAGKQGPDDLIGGGGDDRILGNEDDDTLVGGAGADEVFGGVDSDRCDGESEIACEMDVIDYVFERFLINQAVPQADSAMPANERIGTVEQRGGIVRAFVSANQEGIPSPAVYLTSRKNGVSTSVPMSGPATVPTDPSEADLTSTFNFVFDESLLEPGTQMYVQIDPFGETLELAEANNRYPSAGWDDIDTRNVPVMKITVVPITIQGGAAASISPSQAAVLLEKTLKVHPIGEYDIQVRSNYVFENPTGTSQDWITLLNEMADLREAEDPTRQYHAFLPGGLSPGIGGIGYVGYPAAVSIQNGETIAHETGHNLSLPHNPCSGEGDPDLNYPYAGGKIGTWGYDIVTGATYDPDIYVDLMTYCSPEWVSDYSFRKVLDYRSAAYGWEMAADAPAAVGTGTVVQFSGMVPATRAQAAGQSPLIAFNAGAGITKVEVVDRAARLPEPGDHTLVARTADGEVVTTVPFQTYAIDHAAGAFFIFSIQLPDDVLAQVASWSIVRQGQTIAVRQVS